jgi:L-malate glycosyltransferase
VREKKRKRLLVLCPNPVGVAPAQRLKYEQYFDYLEENGIDVTVSPFMTDRFWKIVYEPGRMSEKIFWTIAGYGRRVFDLVRAARFDAVYVALWVTPFGPPIFERLLNARNPRLVYDIDDMIFLGHSSKANRAIAWLKGRKKMIELMKAARHVIVCTPTLDAFVQEYNPRTTDISSTINTREYWPLVPYDRAGPLTIGWSGSHSTVRYLRLLESVLRRVQAAFGIKVLVIGDPQFRLNGVEVEAIPWRRESEVADLRRIDIGVYPLPDEPWVYGKSGLKALQYMALGIPTVAAAIGANYRVIEDGVSGFLATGEDEWVERLVQLIANRELRRRIGLAARQRVEATYSVLANRDTYLRIVKDVVAA